MTNPTEIVPVEGNLLDTPRWFAMRATYRRELEAKRLVENDGMECFVPMRTVTVKIPHRTKPVVKEQPAVASLVFVHGAQRRLQQTKDKVSYLQYIVRHDNRQKITIPDSDMERFMRICSAQSESQELLFFNAGEVNIKKGARVRIIAGPFEGMEGVFLKVKGARNKRVVIELEGVVSVAMASIHPDLIQLIEE